MADCSKCEHLEVHSGAFGAVYRCAKGGGEIDPADIDGKTRVACKFGGPFMDGEKLRAKEAAETSMRDEDKYARKMAWDEEFLSPADEGEPVTPRQLARELRAEGRTYTEIAESLEELTGVRVAGPSVSQAVKPKKGEQEKAGRGGRPRKRKMAPAEKTDIFDAEAFEILAGTPPPSLDGMMAAFLRFKGVDPAEFELFAAGFRAAATAADPED